MTGKLMRWAMGSWERVSFLNRFLFGTIAPRVQLDVIPALACASHVLLSPERPAVTAIDFVHAGVAMQRLWLTATSVGLHLQPEMTPLIFRWYARAHEAFSAVEALASEAAELASRLEKFVGATENDHLLFMCRVGISGKPKSRSL